VGGGTTVSAAIVGAVYALAGPPAAGTLPVTYPYLHTGDLYPVTNGTDAGDGCSPAYLCTAGPGYNGPAGWGTPDGTGAFTFGAQTADYIALASPGLQSHVSALPYSVNVPALAATDSAPNETITYAATGLPPGVTFDTATGGMSGQISTAFYGTSTITASDPTGAQATVSFGWDVQNSIFVEAPYTPQTEPDTFVSQQISATDEAAGQTLTYAATGLPPGLSIDPATGVISGTTSSTIATYHVTVTATDGTGSTGSTTFTWNVWNLITVSVPEIEHFEVGVPASVQVTATDTATGLPFTFSLAGSGSLPPGLSLDPTTGVISGTPTTLGQYTDLIEVTDGTGSQGLATFDWVVAGHISISTPGALSTGAGEPVTEDLSVTDSASGDTLTYSMSGAPPGLMIQSGTPVISGWTESAGSYTVTVTASDQWGGTASVSFTWTVPAAPATGPTGPVPLSLGGKCLDDTGNRSTNGNKIQIWTCTGGTAQRWTIARDGTIRIHGKCLDVTGRSTLNGAKLQLWSCTGGLNQAWVPTEYADLQGVASGKCLTDPGATTRNGTQVQIQTCGTVLLTSQQWTLPAGSLLLGVSGKCVDDWGARTTNGNPIQVYTCNGDKAQAWTFEPDGTVRVLGKCLTFGSPSSGGAVTLSTCEPPDGDQQWAPLPYYGGIGFLLSAGGPDGGYCLSDPGDSSTNGTRLTITTCGGLDLGSSLHFW
jgi:Ricin-type beta-trefoil lectin domain/Putative Ig domain